VRNIGSVVSQLNPFDQFDNSIWAELFHGQYNSKQKPDL
jgi:hypothetical protein